MTLKFAISILVRSKMNFSLAQANFFVICYTYETWFTSFAIVQNICSESFISLSKTIPELCSVVFFLSHFFKFSKFIICVRQKKDEYYTCYIETIKKTRQYMCMETKEKTRSYLSRLWMDFAEIFRIDVYWWRLYTDLSVSW